MSWATWTMKEYNGQTWHVVGRGECIVCENNSPILGEYVMVNGSSVEVIGIESNMTNPPKPVAFMFKPTSITTA